MAFATISAPMFPPAPGLFSMTMGWPRAFLNSSEISRAMMSVVPPAENPITMVIGRLG